MHSFDHTLKDRFQTKYKCPYILNVHEEKFLKKFTVLLEIKIHLKVLCPSPCNENERQIKKKKEKKYHISI